MGLLDVLGIVFIVLKLIHVIDWSWIVVLLPFIIKIIILIIYVIVFHIIYKDYLK